MSDSYYDDGTVSITNNTTALVGVGTAWLTQGIQEGDKFLKGIGTSRIATVVDDTHITLAENWTGGTLSGATYAIEYLADGSRLTAKLQELVTAIGDSGNLEAMAALTMAANESVYATGPGAFAKFSLPALARQLFGSGAAINGELVNAALKASVGSSALTVELKQRDATTDCSATAPGIIAFRSSTLANGDFTQRTVTGALSLTVPSGATMGQSSGVAANLYVYAIDNAGTVELAVAGQDFGDGGRVSTTVLNTSSDDGATMYSTTARSNVGFRKLGVLVNTQATAGTWATAPSEIKPSQNRELETEAFKSLKDDATTTAILATLGITAAANFSPTVTPGTNCDAASVSSCRYVRIGNICIMFGTLAIDATAAASCSLTMTIPIASDLTSGSATGLALTSSDSSTYAAIPDNATDVLTWSGIATSTASRNYRFMAIYIIA